jgi:aminocarboxymuconate-semialdehyde decarboxylase
VDSLTHDTTCLKYVVELFGKDKVALGTDYPFPRTYNYAHIK